MKKKSKRQIEPKWGEIITVPTKEKWELQCPKCKYKFGLLVGRILEYISN